MSNTAAARAKYSPLTREEAVTFLNGLPFLVAFSNRILLPEMIAKNCKMKKDKIGDRGYRNPVVVIAYEVYIGRRSYTFDAQPFRVLRQITIEEYLKVLPDGAVGYKYYYYEIHTD